MKNYLNLAFVLMLSIFLVNCGGEPQKESKKDNKVSLKKTTKKESKKSDTKKVKASERVVLDNKGVGPIKNVELADAIDQGMADKGKAIYDKMCTACHKIDKRFIGPAPTGILDRRAPEWVMNMILNPEEMVRKDPLAKDLLMEFNGSPMANQGLTEEEARSVLEYFRTL